MTENSQKYDRTFAFRKMYHNRNANGVLYRCPYCGGTKRGGEAMPCPKDVCVALYSRELQELGDI